MQNTTKTLKKKPLKLLTKSIINFFFDDKKSQNGLVVCQTLVEKSQSS